MFALDLFNNDHERRIAEGAVDNLEARRIDDLAMKMDDLVARAKQATTPKVKSALMKEFQKCKAERDSYFKIKDECMGYGTLGEQGIPGNVPADKIPGKEDLLKGRGRTYYEEGQLNEYIVRSGDDVMSVLALNLFADLLGEGNLSDYDEEFAYSPEWQAVVANWAPKAEYLQQQLAKYQNIGRKLRDAEADAIDATAYDGSDAYENADIAASYLPKVYAKQAAAIVRLLKDGYANPDSTMHEGIRSVDIATQDQLDHDDAMAARAFDRNQARARRQRSSLAAGVDVGRWLKPYQMLVKNNFEPIETKDRFEYLMQIALKLKGTNAGFSGDTGMSHAARIFGLQHQEQKLVANLVRNCPSIRDLENYTQDEVAETGVAQAKTDDAFRAHLEKVKREKQSGVPSSVPTDKIPGKTDLLKGKGRQTYEAQSQKKNSEPTDPAQDRLLTRARREHPKARNDAEALAMRILDKETDDVDRLDHVNDREDRMIAKLDQLEHDLQNQINALRSTTLDEDQRLHVGDPIVVTAPNEFEGKTGEIYDFSPSGSFVIVDLYNHGKHSMHLSDVEYNQYADDQDDLDESAMSELDAMRQDLELMNDRQFYTAYGISKQAFQQKYRTLLHPAQQQDTPVKEGTQSEEWTVSIDGKPWKSYPGYAQATKAAQTIEKKYGKKTSVTSTVIQTSQAYNDGQADKWHHRQPRNDFEKGTKDYQDYVDGYSGRPFIKQGVAEGQQPMTRNAVIQKLEAIYTKLYKDEDPESYDMPAAVMYWRGLPPDELAMEFEDAIDRLKQSRSNVAEVKADPTGSWVVYDGSKVKRFKTHDGAKVYAEKAGGKVASSEFYQDKIQKKQVNEDEDNGPYMWFKDNIRDPGRPLNMTKDKAIQFVKGREIMQQQVANWGAVVDNAGKVVFRYDPRGRLPERFHGEHDLRDAPADVIHWDAIEPGSPEMTRALGPDRGSNRSDYFNKDTAQDWNDWADEKEKPKHKETDEGLDSYRHMKPNMIKPQNNKIDVANQKFPDPRKPYIENGKVTGIMGPDGKKYMMSKSDTVGADGMIYHWQDPRARSKTGQQGVAEAETDYSKRRQRERDVDAGRPVKPLPKNPQTDYAKKRAKDRKDMELGEDSGNSSEAAERAILHRIMVAHTDLLKQFGPQKVMQAAEEVAYNVGDLDEIGTSDVSAWVNEVRQILGA